MMLIKINRLMILVVEAAAVCVCVCVCWGWGRTTALLQNRRLYVPEYLILRWDETQ